MVRIKVLWWIAAVFGVLAGCEQEIEELDLDTVVCDSMTDGETTEVSAMDDIYFNDHVFVVKDLHTVRVNVITDLSSGIPTYVRAALDETSGAVLYADTAGVVFDWWEEDEVSGLPDPQAHGSCPDEIPETWDLGEMAEGLDYHVEFAPTDVTELRLLLVTADPAR